MATSAIMDASAGVAVGVAVDGATLSCVARGARSTAAFVAAVGVALGVYVRVAVTLAVGVADAGDAAVAIGVAVAVGVAALPLTNTATLDLGPRRYAASNRRCGCNPSRCRSRRYRR